MSASVTHLVVGEQVFPRWEGLTGGPEVYRAFLAGCMLVDLHAFQPVERRVTHFAGLVEEDGPGSFRVSCENFLARRGSLFCALWRDLPPVDRAFAAGYLCHLAVDECWKELGWRLFQSLGITSWAEFPIPGDVSLTAFDSLAARQAPDFARLAGQIEPVALSGVLTHVPPEMFARQWEIIRGYVLSGAEPAEHVVMLRRAGKAEEAVRQAEARHAQWFAAALAWYGDRDLVGPFLREAAAHALEVAPRLGAEWP